MTNSNNDDVARRDARQIVAALDWPEIATALDQEGYAVIPGLFDAAQARSIAALIDSPPFERGAWLEPSELGRGDVFRLAQPLPEPLGEWRAAFYERLAVIANHWSENLDIEEGFPPTFAAFQMQNKKAGQTQPQSSLSRLREHGYQVLHQYAAGQRIFPLQLVALLSEPQRDFTGGEFVMTEQRPRMQSRPMVVPLRLGDAAIITVAQRPVKGSKDYYRVNIKHAISRVRSGQRIGLELLFHDAP